MRDTPFIFLNAGEGEIFINLFEIVRTSKLGNDKITLHMTDGAAINLMGDRVPLVVARLADLAIMPNGANMVETVLAANRSESAGE